eukprot:scaffold196492_cov24-Tisochrysis_lutea.AAC.1
MLLCGWVSVWVDAAVQVDAFEGLMLLREWVLVWVGAAVRLGVCACEEAQTAEVATGWLWWMLRVSGCCFYVHVDACQWLTLPCGDKGGENADRVGACARRLKWQRQPGWLQQMLHKVCIREGGCCCCGWVWVSARAR